MVESMIEHRCRNTNFYNFVQLYIVAIKLFTIIINSEKYTSN